MGDHALPLPECGDPAVSVVGAWAVPYRRVPLSKSHVDWPFGRITIEGGALVLGGAGLLKYVVPRKVVPLTCIAEVCRLTHRRLDPREDVFSIRSQDARYDRITLTAPRSGMQLVLQALRELGVKVSDASG